MNQSVGSKRKFGVEIETVGLSRREISMALRNAGVKCELEDLNYKARGYWKIVTDGSLIQNVKYSEGKTSYERFEPGYEVVSPILSGPEGLRQVALVVNTLSRAGAKINNTCGLHVHVDARDMSSEQIYTAVKRYRNNEDKIDSFLKPERRRNRFAQSMETVDDALLLARECYLTARLSARRLCDQAEVFGRYRKLNLCSYLRHGTLEFRQHHGTLVAKEVTNWIQFCVTFIEDSMRIRTSHRWWDKVSFNVNSNWTLGAVVNDFTDYGILANLPDDIAEFYLNRPY